MKIDIDNMEHNDRITYYSHIHHKYLYLDKKLT